MSKDHFIDKETTIKKAQPVKLKALPFSKGIRVEVEFNFNPYDSTDMDALLDVDSPLRQSVRNFAKMLEEDLGQKLIKDIE
jgi:hypothetical protein